MTSGSGSPAITQCGNNDMNGFDKIIGDAPELQQLIRSAQVIAQTDVPVLLLGESGTGKDLFASAIHAHSSRASSPFISVNCAALPESLAESALFGHRKGAFTGASQDQAGFIREAEGGTLFLDEIGELPMALQAKLLRFLESGECQPLGHSRPYHANVRIIAATNRDLAERVKAGAFREDLYYRLNIVPLTLPSLRERRADIPVLVNHLNRSLATEHGLEGPAYSKAAMDCLMSYHWPGNIRELRNLCERMLILFSGRTVDTANLPHEIREPASTACTTFKLPEDGVRMEQLEISMIRQALERTQGNRSHAARLLGLTRDTLLYRIRKYRLT